jgi:cyclopropane fatty-acyl-phospholipid synthase-like methyltransferase
MTAEFVNDGHLGGYIRSTPTMPHGDPCTWCPKVWDWMARVFQPNLIMDVGCGEGHTVRYSINALGLPAVGVDGMLQTRSAGIVDPSRIIVHDFSRGPLPREHTPIKIDLIWSCEFVEHVEECYSENFLQLFAQAQKAVLLTHAFPGQGGYHHVNCQLPEYWINRMQHHGFRHAKTFTAVSRLLAPGTHWERSGLVFVR